LAYYFAHREQIDRYLCEQQQAFDRLREQSRREHPELYAKFASAREQALSRS
jgi:hypothetical protein